MRLTETCRYCNAEVYRDFRRHRLLDDDGATHQCPIPTLPDIMECACGALVTVLPDGRKIDYKARQTHTHEGVIATHQTPQQQGERTLWEAYGQ